MTATVTQHPKSQGRPVRRAFKERFLALVDTAMQMQPGLDAVLVITDGEGKTRLLTTCGTPESTTYGLMVYGLALVESGELAMERDNGTE